MGKKDKKNQKENADKYERNKQLAAERQRRFKAKMTEEQLEKKRQRDRDRLKRLKEEKKILPISKLKASDQKKKRKQWRKYCATYRKKQKSLKNAINDTPPLSADEEENGEIPVPRQKERGRQQVRRDRAKAYRTISKQADTIKELKREVDKYKKRLQRRELKDKKVMGTPSPNRKVKELVGRNPMSHQIKKQLFKGFALERQLRKQIKGVSPKTKERQIIHKVIGTKDFKQYRLQKYFKNLVAYKKQKETDGKILDLTYTRKNYETVRVKEAMLLRRFFEDDSVSKMCPGKRDFVRKGTNKMQRRILLDTMKNLYSRFIDENKYLKIGFSTFAKSRPFWVTRPNARDRETCACVTHENFEFLVTALRGAKVIKESNSHDILKSLVCSARKEKCISKLCKHCKDNEIQFHVDADINLKYFQWKPITEDREIKGKVKKIKRTIKSEEVGPITKIVEIFKKALPKYIRHVFNMLHQTEKLKKVKEALKEGELLFQIDFSQNYVAKFGTEIQSMHFGASKKQISLHTGVMYYKKEDKIDSKSFCTAADNLDHQSHGVWAHLQPVLLDASARFPLTNTVHIFSDSPSSQYRNKGNFFFMKTMLPNIFKNLKISTWNFSEPGHGKGPMDGVGGAIKRSADEYVNHGNDIRSASDLVQVLGVKSSSMLIEVTNSEVEEMKKLLPTDLPALKGIMGVRQVVYIKGAMYCRRLSCFDCLKPSKPCKHFHLMVVRDNNTPKSRPTKKTVSSSESAIKANANKFEDCVFDSSDEEWLPQSSNITASSCKPKKVVLKVENVFSASEEECDTKPRICAPKSKSPLRCVPTDSIKEGSFVVVSFANRNRKPIKFVGVVQSEIDDENELKIMFMKNCSSDRSVFVFDENDVSYVLADQVVGVLPFPAIVVKGGEILYKFENNICL